MKRFFILLTSFLFFNLSFGKQFHILAEDPAGDPSQSVNDVERISAAIDVAQDSLWLQLDFHQTLSGDVGFVLGLDTDLDPNTGSHAWNGVQSGLNCEEIIIINRNSIDPSFFYGSSSIGNLNQQAIALNDTSILIRMKLSLLDADGIFNLIGGSGFFDAELTNRQIYDEIPETGWLQISSNVAVEPDLNPLAFTIYPQPATDFVLIKWDKQASTEKVAWEIHSLDGRCLLRNHADFWGKIDVSPLATGSYLLRLRLGEKVLNRIIMVTAD